jgi:hypothetical protein
MLSRVPGRLAADRAWVANLLLGNLGIRFAASIKGGDREWSLLRELSLATHRFVPSLGGLRMHLVS